MKVTPAPGGGVVKFTSPGGLGGSGAASTSTFKQPVRAATTAAITLASGLEAGDTIDGVTLVAGYRVLVKNQSSGAENGIYIVQASGAPVRALDFDSGSEVWGAIVYVIAGAANGGKAFVNTNATSPTIDTTALTFSEFGGGSGAPTTADYLVGTAQAGLSAEIVVGTTPGGELGGTWASPTVDASHSGSTHAATQAAAEATAAGLYIPKSLVDAKGDLLTATANDTPSRLAAGTDGQRLKSRGGATNGIEWVTDTKAIVFVIDGGGATITTGTKGIVEVPFGCTITAVRLAADASGSITLTIKKASYSGLFGSLASIVASAKPTLSSAQKSEDATLTGWTTAVSAGDWLEFTVDTITTCQRVTVSLTVNPT